MLYIVRGENFLLDYYFDNLNVEGVEQIVWRCDKSQKRLSVKLRRIWDYTIGRKPVAGCRYFEDSLIERLGRVEQGDRVLFFSIQNLRNVTLMSRLVRGKKMAWLWDSLLTLKGKNREYAEHYISQIRKLGVEQYTFDPEDAQNFDIIALPQVYPSPPAGDVSLEITPQSDIYFVGYDKGRIEEIATLAECFESLGLSTDIRVRADENSPKDPRYSRFYTERVLNYHRAAGMSYLDSVRALLGSRAVLDIVQQGQAGMTLRALEAMFLKRKVITTNLSVKEEPFYHSSRIFILGYDNMESLVDFIGSDFEPVEPNILRRYELTEWIKNFLQ